jgi:hypothetical protein
VLKLIFRLWYLKESYQVHNETDSELSLSGYMFFMENNLSSNWASVGAICYEVSGQKLRVIKLTLRLHVRLTEPKWVIEKLKLNLSLLTFQLNWNTIKGNHQAYPEADDKH